MARALGWFAILGMTCVIATRAEAQTSVCVEVEVRSWAEESASGHDTPQAETPARATPQAETPARATPQAAEVPVQAADTPPPTAAGAADGQAATPDGMDPEAAVEVGAAPPAFDGQGSTFVDDEFGASVPRPRRISRSLGAQRTQVAPPQTWAQADAAMLDPASYLRRLLEYRVTHREGFEATRTGCAQHLRVQLYPLEHGYTAFGRYSGTSREEKVDEVDLDEFRALAERLESALLQDEPIESTLTRRTVLRSDSEGQMRRIDGQRQFLFGVGTQLMLGELPTAPRTIGDPTPANSKFRLVAPLAINIGTRRAFRAWALDAYGGVLIGTSRKAPSLAPGGGHADYVFGMGMTLHFLRYLRPDAVNSFYGGGGASFQLHRFLILPAAAHGSSDGVFGGGMNVDLVAGYELMRASALHFFVETQAVLPAYVFESENRNGRVHSWIPGLLVQIGLLR